MLQMTDITIAQFAHARSFDRNGQYKCKKCRTTLLYVDCIEQMLLEGGDNCLIDVWECTYCHRAWRVWDATPLPHYPWKGKGKKLSLNEKKEPTPPSVQLSLFDTIKQGS